MPSYCRGECVTFTGEVCAELCGLGGIVFRRRLSGGHYVYDIQLSGKIPAIDILGCKITAKGLITGVPANWIESL